MVEKMVAPIYANKKGIYKNLYMEIDTDNKKRESSRVRRQPKGIYKNLYSQITEFEGKDKNQENSLYFRFTRSTQKSFRAYISRMSYFFSSASSTIKMLILACLIAKKPINSYIRNNINYSNQGYQDGR